MGSEWKSDEKLLIFVSLISPAKILLFEKYFFFFFFRELLYLQKFFFFNLFIYFNKQQIKYK